jgi:hypothetical protein
MDLKLFGSSSNKISNVVSSLMSASVKEERFQENLEKIFMQLLSMHMLTACQEA